MAIGSSTKQKILFEIRKGVPSRELSEKFDVPYPTIQSWKKKIETEEVEADVDALLQYDEELLHEVAEELKAQAPTIPEKKQLDKLVTDVAGLNRLEEKTRSLSMSILNQVEAYMIIQTEPNLKELKEAAGIVTTIHNALFNKNTTQVNVLNNNTISSEKRDIFKSSLKA